MAISSIRYDFYRQGIQFKPLATEGSEGGFSIQIEWRFKIILNQLAMLIVAMRA